MASMLIPLHRLLFSENMPAGMDWAVVGLWVCRLRKTPQPCEPILVRQLGPDLWQIVDGRHRTFAALLSGRTHIEAEIDGRQDNR